MYSSKDKKKQALANKKQNPNLEFELLISFNPNKCWALYEILFRSRFYDRVYPHKARQQQQFQNDKVMIDDCFRQFMTPEKLSHQDTWFCSRCKKHKQAVKKIQIFKTPRILIINLKRFKGLQTKQNTLVHFPLKGLDMSEYVISQKQKTNEPLIYDLFGVSNHYGQLLAGHYTAYAKNEGVWYRFNDDQVEQIDNENSIVSNAAYNLFYARRDIDFNDLDYQKIRNVLSKEKLTCSQSDEIKAIEDKMYEEETDCQMRKEKEQFENPEPSNPQNLVITVDICIKQLNSRAIN